MACKHTRTLAGKRFICLATGPHSNHHMRSEDDHRRITGQQR